MTALSGNTTGTVRESLISEDYSHFYRFVPPSQSQTLVSKITKKNFFNERLDFC